MSTQYGFFIDSARCTGCKTCELACKDYKNLTPEVSFRRIYEYASGDWQEDNGVWQQNVFAYYLSIACNHCEDPACTKVCPSGAMHKREDGFVVVNEEVCIGCRYCHMACPYDAPQYNADKGHMTKCDGCHERVAEGKKPICVESCPLRALDFGPIAELRAKHGQLAGLCGPLFIWLMDYSHRGFVKLKLAPPWQLALGGLIVGGLSLITPAVWGNGYSVVQSYLLLPPSGALLVGVFICKLLAVLASSGSGAPGGVFTPTLFVGLAMGMLFACFSRLWLPGSEEMAIMMGLTGMAAFLAATTHAPIMSTLMICEMTGQYTLLPGLLITCVVSSVLSRTLRRDSIYRHHVAEHV
ncbi:TPA: dimethylsulfoxide reductase subunit B [Klebsiella pneumoniae]|nr:dimethylsulfoxide reductase subunit B [Klebsiella pneumoniae]HBW9520813.1 dimethylsulfoxide reductase subunit B [Klebsiella pneumoniae]